jgi:hypothetical protein
MNTNEKIVIRPVEKIQEGNTEHEYNKQISNKNQHLNDPIVKLIKNNDHSLCY